MTTSERSGRLLAAVSVLGVALGMAAPALARDPTAVENPNATGQTSQKGTQNSLKIVPQTSLKAPVDQTSQKGNVTDQTSWKAPVGTGQTTPNAATPSH